MSTNNTLKNIINHINTLETEDQIKEHVMLDWNFQKKIQRKEQQIEIIKDN